MSSLKNTLNFFKKNYGLITISLILILITLNSLKPDSYLLGWDNYSSYFNLKTNFWRTFFATWREYRGLGVPSDSESTDLFRLLFYLLTSPFIKQTLLDQLYILLAFCLGVIAMFFLSLKIIHLVNPKTKNFTAQLFATIASFFYIFNLNTLSTFYFPMIMFVNRYFATPLLFLTFLSLLNKEKLKIKDYLLLVTVLLFTTGAYMVATVFVTTALSLAIFFIFNKPLKRGLLIFLFYILINSYWLLPFASYTINKSQIIRLAPTFIEANETQLNKPGSFYGFFKQLSLYPNFFETRYTQITDRTSQPFHPLADQFEKPFFNSLLKFFPILYLFGATLLILKFKKLKKLLWLPLGLLTFIFLTLKEFSPLGFIYAWINQNMPLFGVLFRFGDTKFHYYLAFFGSFLAAYTLYMLFVKLKNYWSKIIFLFLILLIIILNLGIFNSYFKGNFLGFYLYNDLPKTYQRIAKIINTDPEPSRVLHLPIDNKAYWKSYRWGMVGSSFLHYLLDKPLLDKTFEPGSQENAELITTMLAILRNSQSVNTNLSNRVKSLWQLLTDNNIKYVILDQSVSSEISSRNMLMWGRYNYPEAKLILEALRSQKKAKIKYQGLTKQNDQIILYELANPQPRIRFITTDDRTLPQDFNWLKPNIQDLSNKTLFYEIQKAQTQNFLLTLYSWQNKNEIIVDVYYKFFPTINNVLYMEKLGSLSFDLPTDLPNYSRKKSQFFSNWQTLKANEFGNLRLRVDQTIVPLPSNLNKKPTFLADILIEQSLEQAQIPFELLAFSSQKKPDLTRWQLTDNPNCFQDALKNYQYQFKKENKLTLSTTNGSTCLIDNLSNILQKDIKHLEIELSLTGKSQNLNEQYQQDKQKSAKPILKKIVNDLPKTNLWYLCLKQPALEQCYNLHQNLEIDGDKKIIIPAEIYSGNLNDLIIFSALKNQTYQKATVVINSLAINLFDSFGEQTIAVPNFSRAETKLKPDSLITIQYPKPLSAYAFYQTNDDAFLGSNSPCSMTNNSRSLRVLNNWHLSYLENCYTEIFQRLPFSNQLFYLWQTDYNLLSGKFPKYILSDGFNTYLDEYLSLNQDYPDITGFKQFQNPENIFTQKNQVINRLKNLKLQTSLTTIKPTYDFYDQKPKNFTLNQDSENEGIFAFANFNIIPLPGFWSEIKIANKQLSPEFIIPKSYQFKQILPSLWQVDSNEFSSNHLLLFNEAYDQDWKLYDSILDLIFGQVIAAEHFRCQKFSNCYVLPELKTNTLYLFYAPEKLNFLGWIVTLLSILVFGKILVNNKRQD